MVVLFFPRAINLDAQRPLPYLHIIITYCDIRCCKAIMRLMHRAWPDAVSCERRSKEVIRKPKRQK